MKKNIIVAKRELGKTGIKVAPIGLGTWQFSGEGFLNRLLWDPIPKDQAFKIIQEAYKSGINLYDSAEMYGFGESEKTLAEGLKRVGALERNIAIATKWRP